MGVGMHECQVTELNPAQIKLGVATPGSKALEFEKMKNMPSKDPRGYSSLVFGRDVLPQTLKVHLHFV